ncbi:MAG: hypothetical protein J6W76_01445 [Spirochaetales bacterium]|nr:hypothetical protein [Spirochaetales bacterium]
MKNNTDDFYPNGKDNSETIDPMKLAYILLARKILTPRDFDFMSGRESFDSWKQYNKDMVSERMKGVKYED